MRSLSVIIGIICIILTGCNADDLKLKELTSDKKGTYALYVVGDELDGSELGEQGIKNINFIMNAASLEIAQQEYPFLKIKKTPEYLVFDHKELQYRTSDFDNLVEFLKKENK